MYSIRRHIKHARLQSRQPLTTIGNDNSYINSRVVIPQNIPDPTNHLSRPNKPSEPHYATARSEHIPHTWPPDLAKRLAVLHASHEASASWPHVKTTPHERNTHHCSCHHMYSIRRHLQSRQPLTTTSNDNSYINSRVVTTTNIPDPTNHLSRPNEPSEPHYDNCTVGTHSANLAS